MGAKIQNSSQNNKTCAKWCIMSSRDPMRIVVGQWPTWSALLSYRCRVCTGAKIQDGSQCNLLVLNGA